jgi:hypothetical protein
MDAMVRRNACAASSAIYTDHLPPSGRTYALSVSEAEDIRTFGLRKTHLDTILLDLSRYLLLAGIRLAHSGHLRADGYTIRLADLLYDPIVEQLRGNAPGGVARVPELVTYIPLANTDHSDFIKLNFRSPYFSSIPLRVKFCRRAQKVGMGGGFMSQRGWVPLGALLAILVFGITSPVAAQQRQFVPNSQSFWANSKNWTSNYGPAYRDTVESPTQLLPCSSQFALCFHSGAEPLPCTISKDGRSAQCKCTVATSTNYTLINAILNYPVYLSTVAACGADGSSCTATNSAPVCSLLDGGKLIPGAKVISTFDPDTQDAILAAIEEGPSAVTVCAKAAYAACMTAPCKFDKGRTTATCKCPVFYGRFTLVGADAECSLGGNLVPSASYIPELDSTPNN